MAKLSVAAATVNVQHDPQLFWFLTEVTFPESLQSRLVAEPTDPPTFENYL